MSSAVIDKATVNAEKTTVVPAVAIAHTSGPFGASPSAISSRYRLTISYE